MNPKDFLLDIVWNAEKYADQAATVLRKIDEALHTVIKVLDPDNSTAPPVNGAHPVGMVGFSESAEADEILAACSEKRQKVEALASPDGRMMAGPDAPKPEGIAEILTIISIVEKIAELWKKRWQQPQAA